MEETGSPDFISLIKHIPELDVENAIETIGGAESLYEKILKKAIRLLPSKIEDMEKSLYADNDLRAFYVIAHGIKGSLNQVGCFEMAKLAEALEKAAKAGGKPYCDENCGPFIKELRNLCGQVNAAALQSAKPETNMESSNARCDDINDFAGVFARARDAATDYDSISAVEILLPLTGRRFGGDIDALISKAVDALDVFKPRQALGYITELLNECDKPPRYGTEERS